MHELLVDHRELGHEGLEVEDLLGALLDAVLVEGRAGHDLGLELVVELRDELRAELLEDHVRGDALRQ